MAEQPTKVDSWLQESVKKTQAYIRKNKLATGGGEPIPKGQKRTTEHRVMQPRDDKGRFDANASAGFGLKYPHRGKDTVPYFIRKMGLSDFVQRGVGEGETVQIAGHRAAAIQSIDADALLQYFYHFDEEAGSFYMPKFDEKKWNRYKTIVGEKGSSLGLNFVERTGRMSKKEKENVEEAKASGTEVSVTGKTDLSRASESTKQKVADNLAELAAGNITISMPSPEDSDLDEATVVDRQMDSVESAGKDWDNAWKAKETMKSDIAGFHKKNERLLASFAGVINAVGIGGAGVNSRDVAEMLAAGTITLDQLKTIVDKISENRKKGKK